MKITFFCNGINCDHNRTVKKDAGVLESKLNRWEDNKNKGIKMIRIDCRIGKKC